MRRNGWSKSSDEQNLGELTSRKIDFSNEAHQKALDYWQNIALESNDENERKELTDLAHLRAFLAHKAVVKKWCNQC